MKFVVIDDDPTGSQTVQDCLLLLKWDCSTLVKGFESKSNLFFILANTESAESLRTQHVKPHIGTWATDVYHELGETTIPQAKLIETLN